jgi:tetratricopeptide (TPR) repeat protein
MKGFRVVIAVNLVMNSLPPFMTHHHSLMQSTTYARCWLVLILLLPGFGLAQSKLRPVQFGQGTLEIPTYTFGRGETGAPLFRSVPSPGHYPYTAMDRGSLSQKPVLVKYDSLILENEYLKVILLPELGGRLWSAYDKVSKRDIFYNPGVIKPSRYNQRQAWPVGNLEVYGPYDAHMLTWPGEPWAWAMQGNVDGSASVVLSHIDHFFRNKISLQVTLHPARAFIETTILLHNRNLLPNRYLLWTNAGVPASEGTRFVYPMTKTIGHDSSELGTWPVENGVDLSWYKNNKNMLGVFGLDLYDHFISAYDYTQDYGTICTADRFLARGVKTWTWGTGPAAQRHMQSYTDSNVPYVEVQSGRFVWDGNYEFIGPGMSDGWTEYWYGAGGLGGLSTASRDLALSLELPSGNSGSATLTATPTGNFPATQMELLVGDETVWKTTADLLVGKVFKATLGLPETAAQRVLLLKIMSSQGTSLAYYSIYPGNAHPNAIYASDAVPRKFGPLEALTAEEAFQKGLGHEKFGQLDEADTAYQAALSKDGGFVPAHLQLGLMALDRVENSKAIEHFEAVLKRDPVNSEAHYYLGVAQMELGNLSQARLHFYRLLPSSEKFKLRDYGLGLLALASGDLAEAGRRLRASAQAGATNVSIRQAYLYWLRKTGQAATFKTESEAILKLDPTNAFVPAENWLTSGAPVSVEAMDRACARHPQGYLELATDYMRLSAWQEAGQILDRALVLARTSGQPPYPMLHYYRAFVAGKSHERETVQKALNAGRESDLEMEIYPFRRESVQVLSWVRQMEAGDANARALLGDLLYHEGRRGEALECWREALKIQPQHFPGLRDLGLALLEQGGTKEALPLLTRASEVRPQHLSTTILVARLNAKAGQLEAARETLERALQARPGNDELIEGLASVQVQLGAAQRAMDLLSHHTFEPRHQSYSLLRLYQATRLMLALDAAGRKDFSEAVRQVELAAKPSANLGMDDFAALESARIHAFLALLKQAREDQKGSLQSWRAAAATSDDDVECEGLFRAIGLWKTGQKDEAEKWFNEFERLNPKRQQDNSVEVRTQAFTLAGLYAAFRKDTHGAKANFQKAIDADPSNLFARQGEAWLEAGLLKTLADVGP